MKTIGELCDTHGKHVSQGGKDPFYITVVEPLLSEIEASSGLKGSYEVEGRFDVKALARFRKGDKTSQQLLIDYTGEAPDGGRSLMIWINPNKGSWGFSVLKRHNPLQPPWLLASSGVLTSS